MRRVLLAAVAMTALIVGGVAYANHGNPDAHIDAALAFLAQVQAELEAAKADAPPPVTVTQTITVTVTEAPAPTTTTAPPPSTTTPPAVYPPPSTEGTQKGFSFNCDFSHRAQVDPIVSPGQVSAHMHDFFGNVSVNKDSTYSSMLAAGTTCNIAGDTAGYWAPSLVAPDGSFVTPTRMQIYYRNRPAEYGTTVPFPADFRLLAGGSNAGFSNPITYWNCDGQSDGGLATRQTTIPNCTGTGDGPIEAHMYFPNCWDGRLDSGDHRSHVVYPRDPQTGAIVAISNDDVCPASHPIKLPQIDIRILSPVTDGTGYVLSDGAVLIHSDFWNTWDQAALEARVETLH